MAAVRTFVLPHYEAYPVQVAMFNDVKNADYLRSQLLAANPEFDYAFLDAAMILTTAHLLLATTLSLHAFLHSRPKTRTPHAELVFRLSPNANIGESYKTFGIGPSSTALIAVKLPLRADRSLDPSVTRDTVAAHLGSVVEGESVPIGDEGEGLGALCEVHRVKKVYKIGCAKGKGGRKEGGQEKAKEDRRDVEAVVLGCMALKGQ